MITITSDSPTPGIYDWNYFAFENGVLSYCNMSYYRCLALGNGTEVTNNNLHNVGGAAVACGINSILIEHNTIAYATHELVDIHGGATIVRYNTLLNPDHVGVTIDGGSPEVTGNSISGCQWGIDFASPPGKPTIEDNEFAGNGQNISNNGQNITNQYPNNKF
jgi:hypothetical protein